MRVKNNRFLRRISAALLTGVMLVSMFGMSVAATGNGNTAPDAVPIEKTVKAGADVLAPKTSFKFTVAPGTANAAENIFAGVDGGLYFADGSGKSAEGEIAFDPANDGATLTKLENLLVDKDVFAAQKAGIYRYIVEESSGLYDGMSYDTTKYTVDVYVENKDLGKAVTAIVVNEKAVGVGAGKVDKISFENTYTTAALTVEKLITGNQADLGAKFDFVINISGQDGEQYKTNLKDIDGDPIVLTSGTNQIVKLGNGESIVIYGLSASDTYTITETNANKDRYETTVEIGDADAKRYTDAVTGKINADTSITFTNHRHVIAPTGVILNIAPYILMVALAGIFAVLFLRRRRPSEF